MALRLAGDAPDAPHMAHGPRVHPRRTAAWKPPACSPGSGSRCSASGPGTSCPTLPPEIVFLPRWFPLNLYDCGCWARQTVVPLTIVAPHRAGAPAAVHGRRAAHRTHAGRRRRRRGAWAGVLPAARPRAARLRAPADPAAAASWPAPRRRVDPRPAGGRRRRGAASSRRGCTRSWRCTCSAIRSTTRRCAAGLAGLDGFTVREETAGRLVRRLEACQSPVWDTGARADRPARRGRRRRRPGRAAPRPTGCWARRSGSGATGRCAGRSSHPGGWAFEFANDGYPDTDDTAEVVLALRRVAHPDPAPAAGRHRARRRVDGRHAVAATAAGAPSTPTTPARLPSKLPFCDFGAVIDPPSADVTAHVVEMLAHEGRPARPAAQRGVAWLLRRPGARRLVVRPLGRQPRLRHRRRRSGAGRRRRARRRAGRSAGPCAGCAEHQNPDGGWGEDLRSYDDPAWAGRGELDRLADRMGAARAARRRRATRRRRSTAGSRWPGRTPSARRRLGRGPVHRHRLSPATSTSTTTCTGSCSRLRRSAATLAAGASRSRCRSRRLVVHAAAHGVARAAAAASPRADVVRTGMGPTGRGARPRGLRRAAPVLVAGVGRRPRPDRPAGRRGGRDRGPRADGRPRSRARPRRCSPARCAGSGCDVHIGPIVSRPTVVDRRRPRAARPQAGALAVDMESALARADAGDDRSRSCGRSWTPPTRRWSDPARLARGRAGAAGAAPRPARRSTPGPAAPRPRPVAAGQPAVVLRRRRAGDRHRRAGAATATARRSTCAGRSCTTRTSSAICERRGAVFVERARRGARRAASLVLAAHGVAPAVRDEAAGARPARSSTRPARWSPRCTPRCAGSLAAATRCCSSATPTTRRSRAPSARRPSTSSSWATRPRPRGSQPSPTRAGSPTSCRPRSPSTRPTRSPTCCATRFPALRGPAPRRHLLRHHQPPAGGPRHRRRLRPRARGRLAELVQLACGWSRSPSGPGCPPYLVDDAGERRPALAAGARRIGITAGASAPPHLVDELVAALWPASARCAVARASVRRPRTSISRCPRR